MDVKVDFFGCLPKEILDQIMHLLDIPTISRCLRVSKSWKTRIIDLNIEKTLNYRWRIEKPMIRTRG